MPAPKGHEAYAGSETGGRPRKWATQAQLEEAVKAYFDQIESQDPESKQKPPGIFALCVHTGMSYDTYLDYESGIMDTETEKFSETLQKSRLKVAAYAEEQIYDRTAGATFQLVNLTRKTREPYKNAQHQEVTGANGGPLEIALADRLKEARERASGRDSVASE